MYVLQSEGTERPLAVEKILEDIPGGGTLAVADFPTDSTELAEGALVGKDANGIYHLVKTAALLAGSTAAAPRIAKGHSLKVGDIVSDGDKGLTISVITAGTTYDTLTFASGTLTTFAEGTIIWQCTGTDTDGSISAANAAPLYTPSGISLNSVDLAKPNTGFGILVRGTVRESLLAFPLTTALKATLPLIRFV